MKFSIKKPLLTGALVFSLLFVAPQARAWAIFCTNCSNFWTQMVENSTGLSHLTSQYASYAETIQQTVQQIEMVRQNIQQYTNMVKNTVALPKALISEISGELTRFAQITNSLNTMRADIEGLDKIFDELYLTGGDFKEIANLPRDMVSGGNVSVRANMDIMNKRIDEATEATFKASGAQLKDLEMSGQMESYMNELLDTPDGQMKALGAANQLAGIQIQEARQLRELMATRIQSDLASQIKEEKGNQLSEELARKITNMDNLDTTPNEDVPLF